MEQKKSSHLNGGNVWVGVFAVVFVLFLFVNIHLQRAEEFKRSFGFDMPLTASGRAEYESAVMGAISAQTKLVEGMTNEIVSTTIKIQDSPVNMKARGHLQTDEFLDLERRLLKLKSDRKDDRGRLRDMREAASKAGYSLNPPFNPDYE